MAWEHSSVSANINYYRSGKLWCSVLCSTIEGDGEGGYRLKRLPTYTFHVYEEGVGEIGNFTYEPTTRPNPIALRPRTVSRLVNECLRGDR